MGLTIEWFHDETIFDWIACSLFAQYWIRTVVKYRNKC